MADQIKQIKEFPAKEDFGDVDLLLIQSQGTTYHVQGQALKRYSENAAKPQAEAAQKSAEASAESASNARSAAEKAETAVQHPPVADPETGYWQAWDAVSGSYQPTSVRAVGTDFAILGYYDTLAALEAAIPSPKAGDVYGVGTEAPYDIYVWDSVNKIWKNNGPMVNTGDMTRAVYDPAGRERDIFSYTDSAIQAAVLASWEGSY